MNFVRSKIAMYMSAQISTNTQNTNSTKVLHEIW